MSPLFTSVLGKLSVRILLASYGSVAMKGRFLSTIVCYFQDLYHQVKTEK